MRRVFATCIPANKVKDTDVYHIVGDIALVLFASDDNNKDDIRLQLSTLAKMGINPSDLWPVALVNVGRACIVTEKGLKELKKVKKINTKYGYLTLTSSTEKHGAVVAFVPGVLETVRKLFGTDQLRVLFTSKNKAVVYPPDVVVTNDRCKEKNSDFLTNSLYVYDRPKGLRMIAQV